MNGTRQPRRHFVTTHWSLVLDAGGELTPQGRQALATLCERYWSPLYVYLRHRGHSAEDAQDLTQGFFVHVLEKHALDSVDPARGRFRSFLLASLNHYVSNVRDRDLAQKRGGRAPQIAIDRMTAEEWYQREPADPWTPETLFDRQWALTVLEGVFLRLRSEVHAQGKGVLFEHVKTYLSGEEPVARYANVGAALGMSEAAVKAAVHRLRRRYRELLYQEIADAVGSPDDVEPELRYLIAAVGT
jgi:DNA-directed RNA polymerase specialized sigma24 family protein